MHMKGADQVAMVWCRYRF